MHTIGRHLLQHFSNSGDYSYVIYRPHESAINVIMLIMPTILIIRFYIIYNYRIALKFRLSERGVINLKENHI